MLNVKKKHYFGQCHIFTSGKKSIVFFLQKFYNKRSKLLTLPYCVLLCSLLQTKTKKVYNTQGRGRSPAGGFCRSTWTKILAIEKILRDNIKNIYKILQDNIHKQRQTNIHKEKYIGNWKVGENKKIEALKNILGRQP